ncbi:bifunctional metallophosphatase/5'-nucleotidase [Nonomuraea purpurea]|uniref:Bifunctional metallophosphatase/5'-nucleotidase n=1 Tax=Nonomuraea purpurea TaxID=1849276 RepID=A0ABV8GV20_9ACTN
MTFIRSRRTPLLAAAVALTLMGPLVTSASAGSGFASAQPEFTMTILHNNDGESHLISAPDQPNYGGVARFTTLMKQLERSATSGKPNPWIAEKRGALLLSSGDNYLAGPEFAASLKKGVPYYDALALKEVGYDATAIGNHEFDLGPDVLANFIKSFGKDAPPFVSANLDFKAEKNLQALVKKGTIVSSTTAKERGEQIGIVGVTTPLLPAIASPRKVKVLQNVAPLVQAEVDALTKRGIDKIVLIGHLQGLSADRALVPMLKNVDVVIAGGGNELLANDDTPLVPGDEISTDPKTGEKLRYPLYVKDKDGADVPIATTAGDYKYVGRMIVNFDGDGKVINVDSTSGLVRVSGVGADAVKPDNQVQKTVVKPVQKHLDALEDRVIAKSEVALEGRRDPGVRTKETNLGDLLADALLAAGKKRAANYGVTAPDVALQNGGGIRNNSLIPAGNVSELDTYTVAPFSNFVAVVPNVPRKQFKEIMENSVSGLPAADGRFAQVAGFTFVYDPKGTAQKVTDDGTVTAPGTRIKSIKLDDGTEIVKNGKVIAGGTISLATNDFTARGGDQYPFRGLDLTSVGITYQQALATFITDDLKGKITKAAYPVSGTGRITTTS